MDGTDIFCISPTDYSDGTTLRKSIKTKSLGLSIFLLVFCLCVKEAFNCLNLFEGMEC